MDPNQSTTVPDASQLSAAVGGDNGSAETLEIRDYVNRLWGTNYADNDAAEKGLVETKAYVGKVGQVLPFFDKAKEKGIPTSKIFEAMDNVVNGAAQPSPIQISETDKFATKEQVAKLQADIFYRDNPAVAPYRQAIDEFASATGKTQAEVITMEAFKNLIEGAKGFDEVQKAKSVLQTNPRLGVATDTLTKAQDALKNNAPQSVVADLAVKAVMETFAK